MKTLFTLSFLIFLYTTPTKGQCISPSSNIATPYNSNNGQRGAMFDLTATNELTILCFDVNLYAGTTANYEIYYRPGTFVGNETNAAAWTLVGSTTGLASLGNNIPTPIPITVNVTIPAGQTYGFYITNDFGAGTSYTDGVAANTLLASDANLSLRGGIGKSYPFGLTFNYREINAHAHYILGAPLPVGLISFRATPRPKFVELSWSTSTEQKNDYFTIERSLNGVNWEFIQNVKGAGESDKLLNYTYSDYDSYEGVSYYRISQTDFDGTQTYFDVISVDRKEKVLNDKLIVSPNPSNGVFELIGSKDELGTIKVSDLMGRDLTNKCEIKRSGYKVSVNTERILSSTLIITSGNRSAIVTKF